MGSGGAHQPTHPAVSPIIRQKQQVPKRKLALSAPSPRSTKLTRVRATTFTTDTHNGNGAESSGYEKHHEIGVYLMPSGKYNVKLTGAGSYTLGTVDTLREAVDLYYNKKATRLGKPLRIYGPEHACIDSAAAATALRGKKKFYEHRWPDWHQCMLRSVWSSSHHG